MIHGYSVSGNTFTHASLAPSAAAYFCSQGREVWVVDLRTSTGMPTCTYPWAMEQAGLIDIPAALLHIRNATQQTVDVLAHCVGCVMLSMALLTDARDVRAGRTQLGVSTWLTDEHLGILTAFNGARPDGRGHPCINRIVLSQKGPLLRYTDSNVLRAFVLQSVRRWLLADDYQFRPPRNPTVADELLDRFLSSVPYPDADYDVQNPLWPCKRTAWTATRHRMDALYGRDFCAENMSDATLNAIDDLFGPINLDTVAQTIHFARFQAITNQQGRGEFVTRGRLRKRWGGIPTLALHGRENGLIDVSTQTLLEREFKGAGVPFQALSPDQTPYSYLGHQDVLIGTSSGRVFRDIEAFLAGAPAVAATPGVKALRAPHETVVSVPWLGPRLDLPDTPGGALRIACMPRPDQGRSTLYLFPAFAKGPKGPWAGTCEVLNLPGELVRGTRGDNQDWLFAEPKLAGFAAPRGTVAGYLAFLVYHRDAASHCEEPLGVIAPTRRPLRSGTSAPTASARVVAPNDTTFTAHGVMRNSAVMSYLLNNESAGASVDIAAPTQPGLRAAHVQLMDCVRDWVHSHPAMLGDAFVALPDLQKAARLHAEKVPQPDFTFALASCQYPAGLLDAPVAGGSLSAMGDTRHSARTRVDLALLVGDQIYVDATAGLVDPVRRDERYDLPHETAFRAPAMRTLLRAVPVRMLLDDHEINDGWEPLPHSVQTRRPADERHNHEQMQHGFDAWKKYQRMRASANAVTADQNFSFAGYPFYLADTRMGRSARGSQVPPAERLILSPPQWGALTVWLEQHRDAVKFVATPVLLLPRQQATAWDHAGSERSDAWDGFPASMAALFDYMLVKKIGHTVFLSGDEHHSLFAEITVHRQSQPQEAIKIVSVHSSALYAPFPFANGHPTDLVHQETFTLNGLVVTVRTTPAPAGDGYARIGLWQPLQGPALTVEFVHNHAPGNPTTYCIPLA